MKGFIMKVVVTVHVTSLLVDFVFSSPPPKNAVKDKPNHQS